MQEFRITAPHIQAIINYINNSIPAMPVKAVAELQNSLVNLPPSAKKEESLHASEIEAAIETEGA